jgi:hypothetical protein
MLGTGKGLGTITGGAVQMPDKALAGALVAGLHTSSGTHVKLLLVKQQRPLFDGMHSTLLSD